MCIACFVAHVWSPIVDDCESLLVSVALCMQFSFVLKSLMKSSHPLQLQKFSVPERDDTSRDTNLTASPRLLDMQGAGRRATFAGGHAIL